MSRPHFAIPADFAQHLHETDKTLGARYGLHPRTIGKMRKRCGYPSAKVTRDPPADLAEMHAKHGRNALAKHYHCGDHTLMRWLTNAGLVEPRRQVKMPDDFAQVAPTLTVRLAAERYGVNADFVYRWERATGVRCIRDFGARARSRGPRSVKSPKPAKKPVVGRERPVDFQRVTTPRRPIPKPRRAGIATATPQRDMTRAGQAADFLRRLDPVRRCDASGAFSLTGDHWHFRGRLFDAAGIIERAARVGFDPDAWQRVNEGPRPFGQIAAGIVASMQVTA